MTLMELDSMERSRKQRYFCYASRPVALHSMGYPNDQADAFAVAVFMTALLCLGHGRSFPIA
jgi:hypothetical protein